MARPEIQGSHKFNSFPKKVSLRVIFRLTEGARPQLAGVSAESQGCFTSSTASCFFQTGYVRDFVRVSDSAVSQPRQVV